jgi:hypothetical protein
MRGVAVERRGRARRRAEARIGCILEWMGWV